MNYCLSLVEIIHRIYRKFETSNLQSGEGFRFNEKRKKKQQKYIRRIRSIDFIKTTSKLNFFISIPITGSSYRGAPPPLPSPRPVSVPFEENRSKIQTIILRIINSLSLYPITRPNDSFVSIQLWNREKYTRITQLYGLDHTPCAYRYNWNLFFLVVYVVREL